LYGGFRRGTLRKIALLEGRAVDGRIILKYITKKWDGDRSGLIRLRIRTRGWLL
jgi:hypothetical protein